MYKPSVIKFVTIASTRKDITTAISALEERAHQTAAMSQGAGLINKEDTEDWNVAQNLRYALAQEA